MRIAVLQFDCDDCDDDDDSDAATWFHEFREFILQSDKQTYTSHPNKNIEHFVPLVSIVCDRFVFFLCP